MKPLPMLVCLAVGLSFAPFRAAAELKVSAGVSTHSANDFHEPLTPSGTAASDEKPRMIQEQPNPVPAQKPELPGNLPQKKEVPVENVPPADRTVPHNPSEKIIPSVNKELPLDKVPAHPKEIIPPSQSPPAVMPSGSPGSG